MTLRDLAEYKVIVRDPVCGDYRAYRVCGFPLPSSGGIAVLQMLKMLERFDLASLPPASFFAVHFVSEAGRLAFADRSMLRRRSRVLHAAAGPPRRRLSATALDADPRGCEPSTCVARRALEHDATAQGSGCVARAAIDLAHIDRRPLRKRGRHDDVDRGSVRQPAHDARRVPAQQRADRLLLRPGGRRRVGRESRRVRQAAAVVDGADDRVRSRGARRDRHRVAGRQRNHQLRGQVPRGHHRLEARPAGGRRASELRQPQRADGARGGHRGRATGAQAARDRRRRRRRASSRAACRRSCAPATAGRAARIRGAKASFGDNDGEADALASSSSAAARAGCRSRRSSATATAAAAMRRSRSSTAMRRTCGSRCCTRSRPGAWTPTRTTLDYLAIAHWHHFRFRQGRDLRPRACAPRSRCSIRSMSTRRRGDPAARTLPYDTLILCVGSVSNDFGVPGAAQHPISLDTLRRRRAIPSPAARASACAPTAAPPAAARRRSTS